MTVNTFGDLEQSLKKQVGDILSQQLHQHIDFKLLLTKDICYSGKVFKIIATNRFKDEPNRLEQPFNSIDYRYLREQMIIIIPLQMHDSIEQLSDYINLQIKFAVEAINKQLQQ